MSATGRSDVRQDNDVYVTPTWSVHRFLEAYQLPDGSSSLPAGATVMDPCAANGELLQAIHAVRPDLQLYALELRPECQPALDALFQAGVIAGYEIGDFIEYAKRVCLDEPANKVIDAIVTNPPYALAEEFVRAALKVSIVSAFLMRVNFLGAKKRRDFTAETKPGLFISPNRPSFTGWGGDATEYAWFLYGDAAWAGAWTVLPFTPAEVIKEWNAAARLKYPHLDPRLKKKRDAEAETEAA